MSSCPLPQWLPVLEEREQKEDDRKGWDGERSVKGRRACGAMKSTLLWLLFQLVRPCNKPFLSPVHNSVY